MTFIVVSKRTLTLLFQLLLICSGTKVIAQKNYNDFFIFKKTLFEIKLVPNSDNNAYDLTLTGPGIHIGRADSPDTAQLRAYNDFSQITFDNERSATIGESTSLSPDLTSYKTACIALLARKINNGNISGPLISKMLGDQALQLQLNNSYNKLKNQFLQEAKQQEDIIRLKNKQETDQTTLQHIRTIDSLVNIIDHTDEDNRYGGYFEMADMEQNGIPISNYFGYRWLPSGNIDMDIARFYADTIIIQTFNNLIDKLLVTGRIWHNGKFYPASFYNDDYSIPLKHLFKRNQNLFFYTPLLIEHPDCTTLEKEKHLRYYKYSVNISDLIRLSSYKNHFTFMIKNDSYQLTAKAPKMRYKRREFYDYLSVTTFLDFLGVMEKMPNGLIQLEGKMRLPLRLVNSEVFKSYGNIYFPKLDIDLNATFINGSQSDNRYASIFHTGNASSADTLYIDNFDLVRKYNIRTGFNLGIFKHERKNANINFYIEYDMHFFRTTLRYLQVMRDSQDEEQRFNAWSYTHGPSMRFEYRPDQNLGADLSFAVNMNQRLVNSESANLYVSEARGPLNKNRLPAAYDPVNWAQRMNYKMEMNAYFMVNPSQSNGGLYFRLLNYFSYDFKQLFPQVLVGYSTRLNGMINNIRNKAIEQ